MSTLPEVSPRAGHLDLVGAVAEAGGVHAVGRGVLGVLVVPGVGELRVDEVDVLELVPVDPADQIAREQALHVLTAGEDQVVGDPRAQLGHHGRHRVEVRLAHLHPVELLEALDELGIDVLRVVEVDEIAIDLLLDRLLGLRLRAAVDVAHAAAGEPEPHGQAGAALQQLPAVGVAPHAAVSSSQPSSRSASARLSSCARSGVTSVSPRAICTARPSSSAPRRRAKPSGSAGPNSPRSWP